MDGNSIETTSSQNTGCFKEAVCIDAMRVYDSCSEIQWSGYKYLFEMSLTIYRILNKLPQNRHIFNL